MGFVDFFATYDTAKFVRVRSVRLGFLWWALLLLVLIWSVSSLFAHRSFRALEKLESFVDVSVREDGVKPAKCASPIMCTELSAHDAILHREQHAVAITTTMKVNGSKTRVESAVVFKMEHAIFCKDMKFHANGRSMTGRLVKRDSGEDDNVLRHFGKGKAIEVSVEELIAAAGVDMEEPSDVPGEESSSLRDRGSHFIVSVHYSDAENKESVHRNFWGRKAMDYEMRVRRVRESQFKVEKGVKGYAKYGVIFHFQSSGELVKFAGWASIFTSLAQSVSLITVTTVLVDLLAVYLFKESKVLYPEKFSQITKLKKH